MVNSSRIARRHPVCLDVGNHHGVRADPCMCADLNRPKDLGAGADVDMAGNFGNSAATAGAKRDLVENQAVHADLGVRMDDNAIGVGDQQPAADLAGERYFRPRHRAPEAMTQDDEFAAQHAEKAAACPPELVAPNRQQQLTAGVPELPGAFPAPVGNIGTDLFGSLIHLGVPVLKLNPNSGRLGSLEAPGSRCAQQSLHRPSVAPVISRGFHPIEIGISFRDAVLITYIKSISLSKNFVVDRLLFVNYMMAHRGAQGENLKFVEHLC